MFGGEHIAAPGRRAGWLESRPNSVRIAATSIFHDMEHPMKRASLTGAIVAVALAAASGAWSQAIPPGASTGQPEGNPLVATVNGTEIHRSDIELFYRSLPPQLQQIPMDQIFPQLVERYVDQKLIGQAARKSGVADRPEVKQQIALLTESVISQAYMDDHIRQQVTESRLHEEYQKTVALEPKREEVRAQHILVKTKEEAEQVIKELKAGGDFVAIAKKTSLDPSGRTGGDLGYFTRDQMVPAFSDAAFKLRPGEYTTAPVQTQFGWHVIKLEDRRIAGARKFEEMSDELRQSLTEKAYEGVVKDLRAKAQVVIVGESKIKPVR
jgi:peptidyl-prolyl cis-trans isomerase C